MSSFILGIAHRRRVSRSGDRKGLDNGIVLLVWGLCFLLDMIGFDLSRLTGSPLAAVLWMSGINAIVVGWRIWYSRRCPVRLRQTLTNRVIFFWSWYYLALVLLGVGAWAIVIGSFPPGWFTLLGVAGALPLLIAAYRQRQSGQTRLNQAIEGYDYHEHTIPAE